MATEEHPIEIIYNLNLKSERPEPVVFEALVQVRRLP
jgi:hypothetical protein